MHAIVVDQPGPTEVMRWAEVPDLSFGPDEVLIEVLAAGVNRADLLQRQGFYPPPPGASEILGLECSGRIAAVGADVTGWQVGDSVCALLEGGGYAQYVAVAAGQVMPVPSGISVTAAAALPEVACTVYSNLVQVAGLTAGEWVLLHGGSSGIGTHAIQLCKALGAQVAVTAGTSEKLARCRALGADLTINYREQDFAEVIAREIGGVDIVLDNMGAKYLERNVNVLNPEGRLVIIGLQGGIRAELNLGILLMKRGTITATSLRARPKSQKAAICAAVVAEVWPLLASGDITPVIDSEYPITEAPAAHAHVEASHHVGKVLLTL